MRDAADALKYVPILIHSSLLLEGDISTMYKMSSDTQRNLLRLLWLLADA